jgi:flagellar biosynthesis protein FlhB
MDCICQEDQYRLILYLVPIFGIIFGTTLLFFLFQWWHRQRMELIRRDLYKPEFFDLRTYSFFLGLLLTFTGLAISLVFVVVLGKSLALLGGLIPFGLGLGLLTYYKMSR